MSKETSTYKQGDVLYFYWGYTNSIEKVMVGAGGTNVYMESEESKELVSFALLSDIIRRPHGSTPEEAVAEFYKEKTKGVNGELAQVLEKFKEKYPDYPGSIEVRVKIQF